MNRETILTYLAAHKDEFEERFGIAPLALFGSFARDEAGEASDIDLLIRYSNSATDAYTNKRSLKMLLEKQFHRSVDLANEKCLKPFVRENILRDAVYV